MVLICSKGGTECGNNQEKNRVNSAPAVKGLKGLVHDPVLGMVIQKAQIAWINNIC